MLLSLPGVQRVRWLGTWALPKEPRKPGKTFRLGEVPKNLMDDALAAAEKALHEQYGPDALESFTEKDIETIWLPMVESAIDQQWTIWKAAKRDDD